MDLVAITEIEQKIFFNDININKFEDLTKIERLDAFTLCKPNTFKIHDLYLDTKGLSLYNGNSYVRLRQRNDEHLITLRISESTIDGIPKVHECTHPLNYIGVRLVLTELQKKSYLRNLPDFSHPDFLKILQKAGLSEIISIHNDRIVRDIFAEDINIGRIKFDCFYYAPFKDKIFFEIEIDSYKKIFLEGIRKFKELLKDSIDIPYTEEFKSKYVRGIENEFFHKPRLKILPYDKKKL